MKVAVVSYYPKAIVRECKKQGLKIVKKNPDVVIAFGGEGTFLYSEQIYPGIPKFLIGHPRLSKNYEKIPKYIKKIKNKQYKIEKAMKLEVKFKNKKMIGINDVNIHYRPPCALRFNVFINNKKINREIIGDGVVVSTPYGSSAYFHSITRRKFSKGIGVSFNNTMRLIKPVITKENSVIKVKILRGEGTVSCDNRKSVTFNKGDLIIIKKHSRTAKILRLKSEKLKVML